jgi:hypothetical protein
VSNFNSKSEILSCSEEISRRWNNKRTWAFKHEG